MISRKIVFIISIFSTCFLLCSCNDNTVSVNGGIEITTPPNNTAEAESDTAEKTEGNVISVNKADWEGYWHSSPVFSGSIQTAYEFFYEGGDGGEFNYYNNDIFWEYFGNWELQDGNVLELEAYELENGTAYSNKVRLQNFNIEYISLDELTNGPAIIIDNQKFWKMNKPQDFINGLPLYINYSGNFPEKTGQSEKAIRYGDFNSQEGPITIFCDADLYDFKIRHINYNSYDDDGFAYYAEYDVFSLDKLETGYFIEFVPFFTEVIPYEVISFADKDGTLHSYLITNNGKDGSTCASKYDKEIPYASELFFGSELFSPIIDAYAALEQGGYNSFEDIIEDSLLTKAEGISYNTGWNKPNALMYAFYDINSDGLMELLIGADNIIFGIYALQNGNPVSVLQVESRHAISLLKDNDGNCVIEHSWGHMGYATEFFYSIDENGKLITLDKLYTNGDDINGDRFVGHFRAKDFSGEEVSITEEEYCSLIRKYGAYGYELPADTIKTREIRPSWKLASDYDEHKGLIQ